MQRGKTFTAISQLSSLLIGTSLVRSRTNKQRVGQVKKRLRHLNKPIFSMCWQTLGRLRCLPRAVVRQHLTTHRTRRRSQFFLAATTVRHLSRMTGASNSVDETVQVSFRSLQALALIMM